MEEAAEIPLMVLFSFLANSPSFNLPALRSQVSLEEYQAHPSLGEDALVIGEAARRVPGAGEPVGEDPP